MLGQCRMPPERFRVCEWLLPNLPDDDCSGLTQVIAPCCFGRLLFGFAPVVVILVWDRFFSGQRKKRDFRKQLWCNLRMFLNYFALTPRL